MSTSDPAAARRMHWDRVYGERPRADLSWTQDAPGPEVALIRANAAPSAAVVDVGSGSTALIGALLGAGFRDLTALDISAEGLAAARAALGAAAETVTWIVADVTLWVPPRPYDLWHDRAVLHFLVAPPEREAYRRVLLRALRPGGTAIISAFAPDGPERCSGLPVRRYAEVEMEAFLGTEFATVASLRAEHRTPRGVVQRFLVHAARRAA